MQLSISRLEDGKLNSRGFSNPWIQIALHKTVCKDGKRQRSLMLNEHSFYITKDETSELMVMLNSFQHLIESLFLSLSADRSWNLRLSGSRVKLAWTMPSVSKLNNVKQVQDDFGRFLLFIHSFWGSQFKTYVKSQRSPLNVKHFYFCPSNLKWFQNEQKSIKIVQKQT